jgi:hypothetical protein
MPPQLVDPLVTQQKFAAELRAWKGEPEYGRRGWVLLREDERVPLVELAILARMSVGNALGSGLLPIVTCAVRISFENYDLWPPSLTFIDAFSREPAAPLVRAFLSTHEGPRDILINAHPANGQAFICLPGIREYHTHPQHSGDDWLLHRPMKTGSLSTICDRLWRTMARNVVGLSFSLQTLPTIPMQAQISIQVTQGEFEGRRPLPEAGIGVKEAL